MEAVRDRRRKSPARQAGRRRLCALALGLLASAAASCAETTDPFGDAACTESACRAMCADLGYDGGSCVDGTCSCLDPGPDGDVAACEAVRCQTWCVDHGATSGECRGDECFCDRPVDAGPDDTLEEDAGAEIEDAPVEDGTVGECTPGVTDTLPCGTRCGEQSRSCLPDGTWGDWGSCTGEGECSTGDTQSDGCGTRCGTHSRTCDDSCAWGDWGSCTGERACEPGTTDASGCDRCAQRVCQADCSWGACELLPGATCEWQSGSHWRCCGPSQWQFCLPSCVWSTDCASCSGCGC